MTDQWGVTPELSIIVVSWNTRDMTIDALRSVVAETRDAAYELIVVDNASSDASAEAIRGFAEANPQVDIRLLEPGENLGFACANNLAAEMARGEFILLLNPDTVVRNNAIDRLVAFARCCPEARIWGGRTVFADGSLNPGSCWARMTPWNQFCRAAGLTGLFKNSGLFNGEAYGGWKRDDVRAVDIVSGCFLLIETRLWQKLGGFAPQLFMYGEDADLCLRAHALGARPLITPDAEIVHYGGASERARADKMVKLLRAKATLIGRHWARGTHWFGRAQLLAWPLSRWLALAAAGLLRRDEARRQTAAVWFEVWARRAEWVRGYAAPAAAPAAATSGGRGDQTGRAPAAFARP